MTNVTVQEALKAAIEVIEQAIPDKRGEFEEQQKLYENYPNLAYKYDYLKVEADEMQQALDKCKAALSEIEKCEPFGYFKAEPFGWTDCAETDEGAIALYEAPTVQREVSAAKAFEEEFNKDCFRHIYSEEEKNIAKLYFIRGYNIVPPIQREGWVSVPIEPTEEMIREALDCQEHDPEDDAKSEVYYMYKAMIQAAPTVKE